MATNRICSIEGCDKEHAAKGFCQSHLRRFNKHGDPQGGPTEKGAPLRFVEEVAVSFAGDECLPWPYATARGYGVVAWGGRQSVATRVVCELVRGPPPSATHEAAHGCGNRICVNPRHLRWATTSENHADKVTHGTHNRGERQWEHKLTEADVRWLRSLRGKIPRRDIAKWFGVSPATIGRARSGETWGWLK